MEEGGGGIHSSTIGFIHQPLEEGGRKFFWGGGGIERESASISVSAWNPTFFFIIYMSLQICISLFQLYHYVLEIF